VTILDLLAQGGWRTGAEIARELHVHRSTALRLLQQLRDEAHRFAVTYNRKRRTMRTVTSELLKVPGIGPVKRRRLLQEFGSIQGVREAGEDAIAKVRGFNTEQARRLLESLAASSPV